MHNHEINLRHSNDSRKSGVENEFNKKYQTIIKHNLYMGCTWNRSCEKGSNDGGGRWSPWRRWQCRKMSRNWSPQSGCGHRGRWDCNPVRAAPRCSDRCQSAARALSSHSSDYVRTVGASGTEVPCGRDASPLRSPINWKCSSKPLTKGRRRTLFVDWNCEKVGGEPAVR